MITNAGHMFHIDFARFLGNIQKWQGIKRERAPFVLTPEFCHVMGGRRGPKFLKFVELGCAAYIELRRHANVFIDLFSLMLSTGISELRSSDDIEYLCNAFELDKTEEQAKEIFRGLIYESLDTKTTQLNNLIHNIAHPSTN